MLFLLAMIGTLLVFTCTVSGKAQILDAPTTISTPVATASVPPPGVVACNNSPLLCSRTYDNVTHIGPHNAAFLRDESTGFTVSGNQFFNVSAALSAGFRLVQAQVHIDAGVLRLCHNQCFLLDAGPLVDFLAQIKRWMDANPSEVVTILLVNADNAPASAIGSLFESSGLSTLAYLPPSTGFSATWPTLQSMITARTRLVTFISRLEVDPRFPYLISEFDYIFETAFEVVTPGGFNCSLDRPSSLGSAVAALADDYLGLVNHFLGSRSGLGFVAPDVDSIATTNSPDTVNINSLGTHIERCQREWSRSPTFLLVDFWNMGPAIAAADALNGLQSPSSQIVGRTTIPAQLPLTSAALQMLPGLCRAAAMAAALVYTFA